MESSSGRLASRDIVQFVALRDVQCEFSLILESDRRKRMRTLVIGLVGFNVLCCVFCRWRDLSSTSASGRIAFAVFDVYENP